MIAKMTVRTWVS